VDNPVDWYPYGNEAFSAAKAQDKPVFVSIGYAACHWCHVMAHESFEDEDTAELMNDLFINIKIDREERPDVDAVYMAAVQVMGESGGWPLSAFCDSSGRPFFLGTYFPPTDRHGRPGFKNVLRTMARIYEEKRDQVEENVLAVLQGLTEADEGQRRAAAANQDPLQASLVIGAGRALTQVSDPHHGGFGKRPKFPSSSAHAFLGRAGSLAFGEPAKEAFIRQCDGMATGGIFDHIGGGFARYSVDEHWTVPHFEKMLSDNGQLLGIYADAYAMTQKPLYRDVCLQTVAWLRRELLDESGGLWTSLDADSAGEEGTFYVWTPGEVAEVLGGDAEGFSRTSASLREATSSTARRSFGVSNPEGPKRKNGRSRGSGRKCSPRGRPGPDRGPTTKSWLDGTVSRSVAFAGWPAPWATMTRASWRCGSVPSWSTTCSPRAASVLPGSGNPARPSSRGPLTTTHSVPGRFSISPNSPATRLGGSAGCNW